MEQGFYLLTKWIGKFQSRSFLEYYASREIFLSEKRTLYEEEIIEKFIEYNWQNVAIFYTGRTKDMENFYLNY